MSDAELQATGEALDKFNAALGVQTNLKQDLIRQFGSGNVAGAGNAGNAGNTGNTGNNNNNQGNQAGNAAGAVDNNFGSCNAADAQLVIVAAGNEFRIQAKAGPFASQGPALNPAINAGFLCQRLQSPCNASKAVQDRCQQALSALNAKNVRGGRMGADQSGLQGGLDEFNKILAGTAAAAAAGGNNNNANQGNNNNNNNANNNANQGNNNAGNNANANAGNNNNNAGNNANANAGNKLLGTCNAKEASLVIDVGADKGGDRLQETRAVTGGAFLNQGNLFKGQGSALNFAIVANFICDRLGDQCGGGANARDQCKGQIQPILGGLRGGRNQSPEDVNKAKEAAKKFNDFIGAESLVAGGGAAAATGGNNNNNNVVGGNNNANQNQVNQGQQQANQGNQVNQGQQAGTVTITAQSVVGADGITTLTIPMPATTAIVIVPLAANARR
jgi:hypothetical protein